MPKLKLNAEGFKLIYQLVSIYQKIILINIVIKCLKNCFFLLFSLPTSISQLKDILKMSRVPLFHYFELKFFF